MCFSRIKYISASFSPCEPSGGRSINEIFTQIPLLSHRETEVFNLLAGGASNRTISVLLQITERTVKAHVAQILSKLDVESRMQAGIVAFAWGIARSEDWPQIRSNCLIGPSVGTKTHPSFGGDENSISHSQSAVNPVEQRR